MKSGVTNGSSVVSHGSNTAMNGTFCAKGVQLKNGTLQQPAAVVSHFYFVKDEHYLRAREVSLDSLTT